MREMKDSGIEWIGNIPATWERCKIKNVISSIGSGTTPTSSNIDYYNSEDICWIQSGDLYKTSYISNTAVSLSAKAARCKYICPKCGNSCRATKVINLICGDCMEKMVVAE